MSEEEEEKRKKRRRLMLILIGGFLAIGIALFLLWLFIFRFEERTEDAYVHGNQVVLNSQIEGYVQSISVNETEIVPQGRILIELDPTDRKLALERAKNALAETVRSTAKLYENVGSLKADRERAKAELVKAGQDYQHRKKLVKIGGVSKEDFQHAEATFIAAFSNLLSIQHQLRGALSLVENTTLETHPLVEMQKDLLKEAYVNLQRCTIRSPVHGMVAMKNVQVGESIAPQTPLMMVIPLNQIWVNANFKETQLTHVRIGQPVEMKSDIYGSEQIYHGKVVGISAGTGSVLSVLPPQNATGNWIKIVQRLPVRICLEQEELEQYPLRLGFSMNVKVDTHNREGKFLPHSPPPGPLYETEIFSQDDKGAEKLIEKILKENSTFSFNEEDTRGGK